MGDSTARPRRALGRGLAALLPDERIPTADTEPQLRDLRVTAITPNPRQPRGRFDDDSLAALATSVETNGVLQPVVVRPLPGERFELIAGERRWRAAQIAGLEKLPAIVRPGEDAHSLELALVENMVREDLNPIDEARATAALIEELGLTHEEVARRVGRSRVAISNLLRLLDLPDGAIELVESGRLTEGHGRALLLAEDHGDRLRLARSAAEHGWSVRELERRARNVAASSGAAAFSRFKRAVSADERASLERLSDEFSRALGVDAHASARGDGCKIELRFDTHDEAAAAASRLGAPQTY